MQVEDPPVIVCLQMQTKQHIEHLNLTVSWIFVAAAVATWTGRRRYCFIVTLNNTTLKILRTSLHHYMFHGLRLSDFAVFVSGRIHSLKSGGRIMAIEHEERGAEGWGVGRGVPFQPDEGTEEGICPLRAMPLPRICLWFLSSKWQVLVHSGS